MNPRFFEETYVKYPFAPMVTFGLEAADWIADVNRKIRAWFRPTPTGLGDHA